MKLLMTTDTIGGVWSYAMELAAALHDSDVDVVLACTGNRLNPDQWTQLKSLPGVAVHQRTCRLEWMDDPWADIAATGQWLLALRDQHKPDIVHLNDYAHGCLDWQVPTLIVGHSCVSSWWRAVKNCAPPPRFDRYTGTVSESLRRADALAAPSQAMAASLMMHYQPRNTVHVIPNGISSHQFSIGPKHPFIVTAGRLWDEAKNIAMLDEAAADLPWRVYIAGPSAIDGSSNGQHAKNARMLGPLPARMMRAWMARADIYALPARYEPFGISVLEAAMSGCCLVLGDIDSLHENWDGAAAFVDPGDSRDVHATLLALIRNPAKRKALADAAHARSRSFTPARMARQYIRLYEQMQSPVPLTTM